MYFFLVLFSYYLMRPLRESFGIAKGADKLPWVMTATLVAMLGVNPVFAWVVSRLPRRRFIPIVYRFFGVNLLLFFALFHLFGRHKGDWALTVGHDAAGNAVTMDALVALGYVFYVWLSVFNLFVVSVFWGFMADVMGRERSRRLFGLVAIGGTVGAIVGSWMLGGLRSGTWSVAWLEFKTQYRVDPAWVMLGAIVPLELALWCVRSLSQGGAHAPARAGDTPHSAEPTRGVAEGFKLIVSSRYLSLIAFYMLLFTITSTLLYLEQGRIIGAAFPERADQDAAFARLDFWTNVLALTTQVFLAGRLISWVGVGVVLLVLPLITVGGFAALTWSPDSVVVLMVFQVARRGLHYAVDRPARESLFAGLSSDAIYKSKPIIDTFVYRAGDMLGGWAPTAWANLWAPHAVALGWLWLPVALIWVGAAALLGKRPEAASRAQA